MPNETGTLDPKKCQNCKADVSGELHTCPFAEEIHNSQTLCNCCGACCRDCADEI